MNFTMGIFILAHGSCIFQVSSHMWKGFVLKSAAASIYWRWLLTSSCTSGFYYFLFLWLCFTSAILGHEGVQVLRSNLIQNCSLIVSNCYVISWCSWSIAVVFYKYMSTKVWENLMCMEADKLFKKSRWYGKIGEALTIRSEASEVSSDDMKQIWRQWSVHIGKIARLGPIYFTIDWMHSIRKGCVDVSTIFSWTRAGDNLVAKQFSHNLLLSYKAGR